MKHASPSRFAPLLGFGILLFALVAVFVGVLEKRFASGEIYPHYSTLRSDPLGSKALYESFAALPGLEVSRNQRDLMLIETLDGDTTLWLCGLSRQAFNRLRAPEDSPVLRAVKEDGARLVITINPQLVPKEFDLKQEETEKVTEDWWEARERIRRERNGEKVDDEKEKAEDESADSDEESSEIEDMLAAVGDPLTELLEVDIESPEEFVRPEEGWTVKKGHDLGGKLLPGSLPRWRSQFRFAGLGSDWKVAATVEDEPVVIERKLGEGTVVLTTDSFFASNEALWRGAEPPFLLWLSGKKPRQVFDETIHGTRESGGVMKIIRRYRFHGFFFGLLIFIALLAWKSAAPLASGSEALERGLIDGKGSSSVAGEETASGLIRLLRRNVPVTQLLRTCLETWRATAGQRLQSESAGQREAIDAVLAAHERAPKDLTTTDAFRRIAHILAHPDDFRKSNRA